MGVALPEVPMWPISWRRVLVGMMYANSLVIPRRWWLVATIGWRWEIVFLKLQKGCMERRMKTPTALENSCELVISLCSLNINCLNVQKVVVSIWSLFLLSRPCATTATPQSSMSRSTTSTTTQRERRMHSRLVEEHLKEQLGPIGCKIHTSTTDEKKS